jgi:hypothetical protein
MFQWVEDFQDEKGNLVQFDPWLREHSQVEVDRAVFQGGMSMSCSWSERM